MNVPKANWSYPTAIRFGAGRISEIGAACPAARIARPLLVTDRGLAPMAITPTHARPDGAAGLAVAAVCRGGPQPLRGQPCGRSGRLQGRLA